jgi:two-component system response regulator LytT
MDVVIVEDEEIVARRLQRLVTTILGARLRSVRVLATLSDGLAHVGEHPIDLLFLDLDLGGRDGFRMLTEAVAGSFHTIVVSARTEEAIRAFEIGVTDFVAKPYTEERLRKAIDRVTSGTRRSGSGSDSSRSGGRARSGRSRSTRCWRSGAPAITPSSSARTARLISTTRR